MQLSRWQAQGNIYLVAEAAADEAALTAASVVSQVGDADGILEVLAVGDDFVDINIWNPDGTLAEMSGNGTRIAAQWLAGKTGARAVSVNVGPRTVRATLQPDGLVEQDMGPVSVGEPEEVAGIRFRPVDVGNPHAVVEDDPARLDTVGPFLETHERFPHRTNVQVARWTAPGRIEARVWERGVGETGSSGSSAVAVAAALNATAVTVVFPGGPLDVRFENGHAFLVGPAERDDGVA
jgi:diaminopimelate epimerase